MISNANPTEWLKFAADDELGQLEPEPHQIVPHGDKFCVGGVVIVDTRAEAEALVA